MQHLFKSLRSYIPTRRKKLRTLLVFSGLVLYVLGFASVEPVWFLIACAIMFLGMILRLWSKGHLRQNRELTSMGPYRLVRHPFYLANGLIDAAICLIIYRIDVAAIYFPFWFFAYFRTIRREERNLETLFGEKFREYKARVPCLIPFRLPAKGFRRGKYLGGFSWGNPNISKGREIARLLLLSCLPLLFFLVWELRWKGLQLFRDSCGPEFLLLSITITLLWCSYAAKLIVKEQRFPLPGWTAEGSIRIVFIASYLTFLFHLQVLESEVVFLPAVLASFLLLFLLIKSDRKLWLSFRFRIGAECLSCVMPCFLAEVPWMLAFPLCYYLPWIIRGKGRDTGRSVLAPCDIKQLSDLPSSLVTTVSILAVGIVLMFLKKYLADGSAEFIFSLHLTELFQTAP